MRITLDDNEIKAPKSKPIKQDVIQKKLKTKKNKIKKDSPKIKKITKIIFIIAGILLTIFLSYAGYIVYKAYKTGIEIGLKLNASDLISQETATLAKDSTGTYTNILIVGIDTRETGNLLNTDTIILVSYNHNTNNVIMMSIPRDFHVQANPDVYWFTRINAVYSNYQQQGEEEGLLRLRDVVTEVTGQEIQYHAMIDYNGFIELIDFLGGIDVNVENSFIDYMYPADSGGYKTVSFEEGPQTMDGETALEYARSRHSMNNNEGSDFARARRQQNVINAVLNKIISNSLLDPQSIMSLFNVIQDNLKASEFTIDDIKAGINEVNKLQESGNIFSLILDPTAGANKLITSKNVVSTGAYAIGPIDGLGNYEDIQEYIQYVWNDPQLYEEDPTIRIYNTGLGYTETREKYSAFIEQFPYLRVLYMGTLYNNKQNTVSYINSDEGYIYSLQSINKYLNADSTEKPEYITTSLNGEDITILYGEQIISTNNTQETE